jgi:hypothetical protein
MNTKAIEEILPTFQMQGVETVFVSECCGRIYVGRAAASSCRTCERTPVNQQVRTDGSDLHLLQGEREATPG